MDSSLNSKDIVWILWFLWFEWFLDDFSDFIVFGHVLAPCVDVLLLGNPCVIFTPAPSHMYKLTLEFMVQIVKKLFFTKPDPLNSMSKNSMSKNFRNYVHFRKMHKFRTTPTQAKTRCDKSKTTLNIIV